MKIPPHARIGYLAFCATAFLVYAATLQAPAYNNDMVAYVGAARQYLGLEGAEWEKAASEDVMSAVRGTRREAKIREKLEDGALRHGNDMSPMDTRALYVLATIAVSYFTGTMSTATYVVSVIAGAVTLVLLGGLLIREKLTVFLLFPVALMIAGLDSVSKRSTPDSLVAMIAVAIVCAGLRTPRFGLWLLPLLPATRPDYILLAPFFAYALYDRRYRLDTIISMAIAGLIYIAISNYFGSQGYIASFNRLIPGPGISSNINDYVDAYVFGIGKLFALTSKGIMTTAIITIGAILSLANVKEKRSAHGFCVAAVCFALSHFLLFPAGQSRYYFVATGLALVVIFSWLGRSRPRA